MRIHTTIPNPTMTLIKIKMHTTKNQELSTKILKWELNTLIVLETAPLCQNQKINVILVLILNQQGTKIPQLTHRNQASNLN